MTYRKTRQTDILDAKLSNLFKLRGMANNIIKIAKHSPQHSTQHSTMTTTIKVASLQCPKCGAKELADDGMLHIRGFKVHSRGKWWSQCLVCSGGYDKINGTFNALTDDPEKGWFA